MKKKILIIDNNIDTNEFGFWPMGAPFRRYLDEAEVHVRRGPQADLPPKNNSYSHILISGSKTSCLSNENWVKDQMDFLLDSAQKGRVVFGVCFGHQILARAFGSIENVRKAIQPEIGWVEIQQSKSSKILEGLPEKFHSFQSHGEEVFTLPEMLVPIAKNKACSVQAFAHKDLPVYGVQFHPESNAEEGERTLTKKLKDPKTSKDCIFNAGRAKSLYSEEIARIIFKNFLKIGKSS